MVRPAVALSLLILAACEAPPETPAKAPEPQDAPTALPVAPTPPGRPLTPAGAATPIQPAAEPDIQTLAAVTRVDELQAGGKLFGVGGGDPAMNGLHAYIAFFASPADGWVVFRLGDVLDYAILDQQPGRVDLELEESLMDPVTTQITSRKRRVIVSWTPGADDAPPATVNLGPAA